jgi:hypothetical protein
LQRRLSTEALVDAIVFEQGVESRRVEGRGLCRIRSSFVHVVSSHLLRLSSRGRVLGLGSMSAFGSSNLMVSLSSTHLGPLFLAPGIRMKTVHFCAKAEEKIISLELLAQYFVSLFPIPLSYDSIGVSPLCAT